jgi:hypothetical protein
LPGQRIAERALGGPCEVTDFMDTLPLAGKER